MGREGTPFPTSNSWLKRSPPHIVMMLGKVFRIGTVRYNWPMSAHTSQAISIAHCTDSEDLPRKAHDHC